MEKILEIFMLESVY